MENGKQPATKKKVEAAGNGKDQRKKDEALGASAKANGAKSSNGTATAKESAAEMRKKEAKKKERAAKPAIPIQLPAPRPRAAVSAAPPAAPSGNSGGGSVPQQNDWFNKGHTIASGLMSKLGWSGSNGTPSNGGTPTAAQGVGNTPNSWGAAPTSMGANAGVPNRPAAQPSWAQTWPAGNPSSFGLNPTSDPVFNPSSDPVFDPSQDPVFDNIAASVADFQDDDPVFTTEIAAPFQSTGMNGAPFGFGTSRGPGSADPWAAPSGVPGFDDSFAPQGTSSMHSAQAPIGGGRSSGWQCEKCGFQNHLSATRCTNCSWDRKATPPLTLTLTLA